MDTLTNNEDPDEIRLNAAFHLGLHCLHSQNESSEKEIQYFLEIITCNPLHIYNGPSQAYCIKSEGRIHCYIKG